MTYDEAKELLKESICDDGLLCYSSHYFEWDDESSVANLDGYFTAEFLIAIATYMKGPTS